MLSEIGLPYVNPIRGIKYICLLLCLIGLAGCVTTTEMHRKVLHTRDWNQAMHEVRDQYEGKVDARLKPYFDKASVSYPPKQVALLTFKKERVMELWARDKTSNWRHIRRYPLTAFSGDVGPKLQEYDRQIPEGIYHITTLNPFSAWHLSMKLDYPNRFDLMHATLDHRTHLGGDIFIHGRDKSVGCLAVGDAGIEELFLLVDSVGRGNAEVVIAPNDLRRAPPLMIPYHHPEWVTQLDQRIAQELATFAARAVA